MPQSVPSRACPSDPQASASYSGPLRPYLFHGMDLVVKGSHGIGDCPFCGREGKFSIDCETTEWRCWACGGGRDKGGGNALVFIRLLHAASVSSTGVGFHEDVARDRRLVKPGTPVAWGVAQSGVSPHPWLVPGYGADGKLNQLYRRTWRDGSWKLLPTPGIWREGMAHALHLPIDDFDPSRDSVVVCEGPWDGMALWECRPEVWGNANIIAVPGCSVWRDEWSELCRGKRVTLLFDSDHPRGLSGSNSNGSSNGNISGSSHVFRAGYDGMRRIARRLSGIAASVRWLKWGPDGYDVTKPSGWDVRDSLSGAGGPPLLMVDRHTALSELLTRVDDVPLEWLTTTPSANGKAGSSTPSIEARDCQTWEECISSWQNALEWRQDMSDALAVLLAVCASTQQGGNQLFLQLIGSAGSGKTTMCDGLLVSHHCHHLEHLTGFHSGWRKEGDGEADCSLISRINGKTLITPEADVLISSPQFHVIMGQQRRIFDGKSGATYKNTDRDRLYVGLRTPWIMAGTPAMMDHDQSHLGDRFLRFIIEDPPEDKKRAILRSAIRSERSAMLERSNGTAGSILDSNLRRAHALTGGYVDWLRANVEDLLPRIEVPSSAEDVCIDLAELSADLRARPNDDKRKNEPHECKELPTRLVRQNIRMACCLAIVLNKPLVDSEVLRIVRKVALDTAYGHSLNIVRWLCTPSPHGDGLNYQECGGLMEGVMTSWTNMTPERLVKYLMFMRKIGILDWRTVSQSHSAWFLTDRVYDLFLRVMGN